MFTVRTFHRVGIFGQEGWNKSQQHTNEETTKHNHKKLHQAQYNLK